MTICSKCGGPVNTSRVARYAAENELQKMGVVLINTVDKHECESCGTASVDIPDLPGLIACVAVYRATMPWRLQGFEIKFLRKAMNISAKQFAELLEVQSETVSRWENDKAPMGPANEKLLRLLTAHTLADRAPGVLHSADTIAQLKISAVQDVAQVPPPMALYYAEVLLNKTAPEPEGVWREERKAA